VKEATMRDVLGVSVGQRTEMEREVRAADAV
jgi:hypothetical protein